MKGNVFNSVLIPKPKSSVFDLTHDHKLTVEMGRLTPVMVMDCLPGDKVHIGAECMLRFMPLVAPVMHRFDVYIHYWFVPNRIVWPNWEKFITGPKDDGVETPPVPPYINVSQSNWVIGGVLDHMGIPNPPIAQTEKVSALPFAAYQRIYQEWYRDQNLIDLDVADIELVDGDNTSNVDLLTMRLRAWEHDYFTAALPFAQKGPAVSIPFGEFQDVFVYRATAGGGNNTITSSPSNIVVPNTDSENPSIQGSNFLYANTSALSGGVEAPTLNDLRRAEQLQKWLEVNARTGNRYAESILGHFGVRASDARLQRPEYITGIKTPVMVSEVLQTSETTNNTPQGNMSGHGVAVAGGKFGTYFCEEHGYIIGILSVMPRTAYMQGIPRHFLRTTDRYQYPWPEFANIGEQEVQNREIYAFQGAAGDATFGYVPRYAENKYIPSYVSGEMRNTLMAWHGARLFNAAPALNQEFVECEGVPRIFAVVGENENIVAHVLNKVVAVRKLPKYGIPQLG